MKLKNNTSLVLSPERESKKSYTEQEAFNKLSALCAATEYCEADMRRKMLRWELPEGAENRIIAKLYKERFIDDRRYAHAFVRDKFRYNHWGRVRISRELKMRNIASNIIDEALNEIPEEDNLETLQRLIDNKRKSVKGKSEYEVRTKLIRFALGRGFCLEDIIKVVGNVDVE